MNPIITAFVASCAVYRTACTRFIFLADTSIDYTWFDALQFLATAGSGPFLLILSSTVVTFGVLSAKLVMVTGGCILSRAELGFMRFHACLCTHQFHQDPNSAIGVNTLHLANEIGERTRGKGHRITAGEGAPRNQFS